MEEIIKLPGIMEQMKKIGLDPNHIISVEYRTAQEFLKQLVLRTERTLIKIQEDDGMDVISDKQKSVSNTLDRLLFSYSKMVKMESVIYQLRDENELLKERLRINKL